MRKSELRPCSASSHGTHSLVDSCLLALASVLSTIASVVILSSLLLDLGAKLLYTVFNNDCITIGYAGVLFFNYNPHHDRTHN